MEVDKNHQMVEDKHHLMEVDKRRQEVDTHHQMEDNYLAMDVEDKVAGRFEVTEDKHRQRMEDKHHQEVVAEDIHFHIVQDTLPGSLAAGQDNLVAADNHHKKVVAVSVVFSFHSSKVCRRLRDTVRQETYCVSVSLYVVIECHCTLA
jgi:hypothetical protein